MALLKALFPVLVTLQRLVCWRELAEYLIHQASPDVSFHTLLANMSSEMANKDVYSILEPKTENPFLQLVVYYLKSRSFVR